MEHETFFAGHYGNLVHKWMHYFEMYDRHFTRYRGTDVHLVEFGVNHGGSLQMWKHYFGPRARIYGIDINASCQQLAEEQVEILIGSQEAPAFLRSVAVPIPPIAMLTAAGAPPLRALVLFLRSPPRVCAPTRGRVLGWHR